MDIIKIARDVIYTEIDGLKYMCEHLGSEFTNAVHTILATKGRTIICGMGKSGIIGKKDSPHISLVLGLRVFYASGEAFHGDLGMVKPEDIFIAI
ncbi:hypothetical protein AB6F55_11790 [Providencia hangzhouensis]